MDTAPLVDPHGRTVRDLRISITDRCNLRCTYCMPVEGLDWVPRSELLTFEEIVRVARVCVERFAFDGIRITGGEPTVRAGLPELVSQLAGLGVDLSLTTNGLSFPLLAPRLAAAGLHRVNISCDSLRPERFAAITRRDALPQVLDGIDAAIAAGFHPVKVNCVLMRGVNDDEAVDFAAFGRERGVVVRFIEFMPLDADGAWSANQVVSADETVAAIDAVYPLEPAEDQGPSGPSERGTQGPSGPSERGTQTQPAQRFRYRDGGGEIGVIASVTRPFCGSCDRVRLTSEGMFRNCLFALHETDLRAVLRGGGTDDDVAQAITADVGTKWAGHAIGRVEFRRPNRSMSQIGG